MSTPQLKKSLWKKLARSLNVVHRVRQIPHSRNSCEKYVLWSTDTASFHHDFITPFSTPDERYPRKLSHHEPPKTTARHHRPESPSTLQHQSPRSRLAQHCAAWCHQGLSTGRDQYSIRRNNLASLLPRVRVDGEIHWRARLENPRRIRFSAGGFMLYPSLPFCWCTAVFKRERICV